MIELETLKTRWSKVRQTREVDNFDYSLLEPGKFCVHMCDEGGQMPCRTIVEATGFFDNAKDALAFYRFAEIPRILHWDRRIREDRIVEAEFYLLKYDVESTRYIEELLELIDDALASKDITEEILSDIREKYNDFFCESEPENQILAWGSLGEILRASCFDEGFKEDMEEEADEGEDLSSTTLKELLDTTAFDENDRKHLEMSRVFLERRFVC